MKNASKLRLAGTLAALTALTALAAGGAASAGATAKGELGAVIQIKGNKDPKFVGPDTVPAGTGLQIENLTNPDKIGPHTFSLVTKDELPKGKDEIKKCGKKLKLICKDIAEAHEVNLNTGEVGKPIVENGLPGWDTEFDGTDPGDSFLTETEDEIHERVVSATPGTKLHFLCAVHPFMQGKIEVGPEL